MKGKEYVVGMYLYIISAINCNLCLERLNDSRDFSGWQSCFKLPKQLSKTTKKTERPTRGFKTISMLMVWLHELYLLWRLSASIRRRLTEWQYSSTSKKMKEGGTWELLLVLTQGMEGKADSSQLHYTHGGGIQLPAQNVMQDSPYQSL